MKTLVATVLVLGAMLSPAWAVPKNLTGEEIAELLPKIIASGEQTRQTFSAAGATTYTDRGRDTYGSWRVQGDKYCSQWPPADGWACYGVEYDADAATLVWIDGGGDRTVNSVTPKN
jgi:hypothetical protein